MDRDTAFVILAGGVGSRMGADGNKVYLSVHGRRMLGFSLETALRCPSIGRIVLVIRPDDRDQVDSLLTPVAGSPHITVVAGGSSRHESEHNGVRAAAATDMSIIAVHDGARPFAGPELIERVLAAARTTGGAIAAQPVRDVVYSMSAERMLDDSELAWAQTPQAFAAGPLLAAHAAATAAGFEGVDTAQVVENFGAHDLPDVSVVAGADTNVKMTFQADLDAAADRAAELVRFFESTPIDPHWMP